MRKVILCNNMSLDVYDEGPGNVMAMNMDASFDAYNLMIGHAPLTDGTPIFTAPADLTLLGVRRFEGSDNMLASYGGRR